MADSEQVFNPVPNEPERRSLVPIIGGAAFLVVLFVVAVLMGHATKPANTTPQDPNLQKLQISDLHMATAENFAGGSVTYIEGKVTNATGRKITDARVDVLFKNSLGETAQKDTLPVTILLRTTPYVDYVSIESSPLLPGQSRDFRLTLEHVSTDWDGQVPQVRVVTVSY